MAGKDTSLEARHKKLTQGKSKATKGAPKSKRQGANDSLSRRTYWSSGRLERRKIRNLVRYNGMTEHQAYLHWHAVRKGRMKK